VRVRLEDSPEVCADGDGLLQQGRVQLDPDVSVPGVEAAASDLETSCDQFFEDAFDGGRKVDGAELVDEPGNGFVSSVLSLQPSMGKMGRDAPSLLIEISI